ncbi:hypothetical protein [Actinoallomurus soli]|uniref:hypothetical protein n=1 Tax=Actinoallomurus soli TaxID=2952535 RepID=UPI00209256BF|nr:hypothetical protein [Actinoallomurus soli]MCO5971703.1 hypothetical protein [Actinoallomurus soli]
MGGRTIPVLTATIPAALGAVATTIYGGLFVYTCFHAEINAAAWASWLIKVVYAPLVLWGPLLALVTVHYHLRRRRSAQ